MNDKYSKVSEVYRSRYVYLLPIIIVIGLIVSCTSENRIRISKKVITAVPSDMNPSPSEIAYNYIVIRELVSSAEPKSVGEMNNKAIYLIRNGEYNNAKNILEKIISDTPEFAAAYNNLGVIYEIAGDDINAERMYTRACFLNPDESRFSANLLGLTGRRTKD